MKLTAEQLAAKHPFPAVAIPATHAGTCFWLIVYPRIEREWVAHLILQIVILDLLLVTIWANPHWPGFRKPLVVFLLMSIGASIIALLPLPPVRVRINATVQGVLHLPIIAASVIGILTFVFRSERPTLDGIFATVVAYLLVAMMFAQLYAMVLVWNPDALHLTTPMGQMTPQARNGELVYFSIVTMSTVGYGDIVPNSESHGCWPQSKRSSGSSMSPSSSRYS